MLPSPDRVALVGEGVRVIACARPFTFDRVELTMPEGRTIAEMIAAAGIGPVANVRVVLDGTPVPRELWTRVRPRPGHRVILRVMPGGSGGGGGNKNVLRIVLTIAVIVVAIAAQQYYAAPLAAATGLSTATAGAIIGATVTIVGGLLVNALIPPPKPKMDDLGGGGGTSPTLSLTGTRNRIAPYGVVPRPYGVHRMFPPLAAAPYTEILGNDQYLRMLFCLGYGPLHIVEPKIGDNDLSSFQGVELEIRQGFPDDPPITLFANDFAEEPLALPLKNEAYQQRVTQSDADEFSVDITFPAGLGTFDNKSGELREFQVQVVIEYRLVGESAWTPWIDEIIQEATTSQVRRPYRLVVPVRGQYEIRMMRNPETADIKYAEDVYWTVLRSIRYVHPIQMKGLALMALRIKASDQLNGSIVDTINCVVGSILMDWDPGSQAWLPPSVSTPSVSNPASIYRDILQGYGNGDADPIQDGELDLEGLQDWHEACAANGFTFNAVIDFETTVDELLRDVAAAGRATPGDRDGLYSVVRDVPQTVPVQHFTPRNSFGYKGRKAFPDAVHAFKVRFINPASHWQQDERIVYDDGYDETNATLFEALELFGCTDAELAYKHARYLMAVARLRPEVHERSTDMEFLVCRRGDLVRVTDDVPSFGLGYARVKAVQVDGGGNATGVSIDDVFPMEAGPSYACRFRRSDGVSVVQQVTTVAGEQSTLAFTVAIPAASVPAIGDLVLFGVLGQESVEQIVKAILPGPDLTATLQLVPAAPAVHLAHVGAIPPWNSEITQPPLLDRPTPPQPIIDSARSDETVLIRDTDGALQSRILLALHFRSGANLAPEFVQAQTKRSDESAWGPARLFNAPVSEVAIGPVVDGVAYDVRLRTVARNIASDWTTITGHVVIGKSTPPPDVLTFLLEGDLLKWVYANPPPDIAGFQVRRHFGDRRVWTDAQPLHGGVWTTTVFLLPVRDSGTVTYLLKAVDVAGNESLNAAAVVANLGDPVTSNIILTTDYVAAVFPGTIVHGDVDAGVLKAETTATFWSGDDAAPFWHDDADPFWTQDYHAMRYSFSLFPDVDEIPADLLLEIEVAALAWSLEYRLAGASPFWTNDAAPFWSGDDAAPFWTTLTGDEYLPWPGVLPRISRQVYEFRITTAPGPVQGVISVCKAHLDVPDIHETIEDFVVAATGTVRLPITKEYRAIKGVTYSIQTDGNGAIGARIVDKDPTLGPRIETYDAAGIRVQGLIDVPDLVGY